MKSLLTLFALGTAAFSKLSPELISKYSIEEIKQGKEGTEPKVGDEVQMHYDGKLLDGTKFDSSYDRGQPLPVRIGKGQVIKCWDEVGVHLTVGEKVKVICPSDTAYGSRAIGPIPANADLVFIIERVK